METNFDDILMLRIRPFVRFGTYDEIEKTEATVWRSWWKIVRHQFDDVTLCEALFTLGFLEGAVEGQTRASNDARNYLWRYLHRCSAKGYTKMIEAMSVSIGWEIAEYKNRLGW